MNVPKNMIWKRMNYIGGLKTKNNIAGIHQFKKSLEHSLRVDKKHGLEFNEDLSPENFIVYQGKMQKLDDMNMGDRKKIINELFTPIKDNKNNKEELTKINSDKSKYAYKLKQLVIKNESETFTSLLSSVLANKSPIDLNSIIATVEGFDLKRKQEKKKTLTTYIELHNKSINSLSSNSLEGFHKKRTVFQEAFFKFPFNQNVSEVKPKDYINIINNFYKKNLPDYPVKLIVFHGDEVSSKKDAGLGVHPHIFIDAKNKLTNEYDLLEAEYTMVNKFRRANNQPDLIKKDLSDAVELGKSYQQMLYEHVNKELIRLNYKDLQVAIIPDSEEKRKRNRAIKIDTSQPKISRHFNSINKALEDKDTAEKAAIESKIKAKKLQEIADKTALKLSELELTKSALNEEIEVSRDKYNALKDDFDKGKKSKAILDNKVKDQSLLLDELKVEHKNLKEETNYLTDKLTFLRDIFSKVTTFIAVCIDKKMDGKYKVEKHRLDTVNEDLAEIRREVQKYDDGQKILHTFATDLDLKISENDLPIKLSRPSLINKEYRIKLK